METVKKKWLWGIFISLLTFFAMSHNASAINVNFENYSIANQYVNFGNKCRLQSGQTAPTGFTYCTFDTETSMMILKEIQSNSTYNFKQGDIIEYYFVVATRVNYTVPGGNYYLFENSNDNGLITLNAEIIDDYSALNFITVDNLMQYENANVLYDFWANYRVAKVYKITQYVPSDGAYNIGFNISSTSNNRYIMQFYQTTGSDDSIMFSLKNAVVYRQSESKENKEVEEKTQGAVDDSQAAGGSSSTDAQTGTTGLLNAITGAVSVISSASPTNCKINGNMGNLDMGQLDLCANPAPAFIQTIGSLILILMCVPLAISLFNRFIAIFRSFQS